MAGKNSRLNRFMQMIGIVDVPQDEAVDRGAYGRESDMDGYRSAAAMMDTGATIDTIRRMAMRRITFPRGNSRRAILRARTGRGTTSRTQQRTVSFDGYAQRGNVASMPPRGDYRQESFASRQSGFEPQRASGSTRSEGRQRTVIYAIRRLEDCQDVIIDLIEGKTMLINLEELHSEDQQRVVDTLSGRFVCPQCGAAQGCR